MRQLGPKTGESNAKSENGKSDCICFVSYFIDLLNISKRLSEVRSCEIK